MYGYWVIHWRVHRLHASNGAKKVYSVDVGYGQLDWKLENDERVKVMERTNIRNVKPDDLEDRIQFFSIDVSFISLRLVLQS